MTADPSFNFAGRPDGLGNRIEEIIKLIALCKKTRITGLYIWNNAIKNRSYEILFTIDSKHVQIVQKANDHLPTYSFAQFKDIHVNQSEMLDAAGKIHPTFNISFPDNISPAGIHIRGTDRIAKTKHPHFMKSNAELSKYITKTAKAINQEGISHILLTTDNSVYQDEFLEQLDKNIRLVRPICDPSIPSEYVDFFSLSLCTKVYMCSKFSSFSITAAMVGNIPLISFYFDTATHERYMALFQYNLSWFQAKYNQLLKKGKLTLH